MSVQQLLSINMKQKEHAAQVIRHYKSEKQDSQHIMFTPQHRPQNLYKPRAPVLVCRTSTLFFASLFFGFTVPQLGYFHGYEFARMITSAEVRVPIRLHQFGDVKNHDPREQALLAFHRNALTGQSYRGLLRSSIKDLELTEAKEGQRLVSKKRAAGLFGPNDGPNTKTVQKERKTRLGKIGYDITADR
ncbi:hypothetical protein BDP27DRAFT_1371470 [Rhodocollybia butyracea]|uniref:Uncharacterized protein n=1 Tax=Rhodocollybia butyracea TaxID=206335 RepID=A0A9P5PC82_9AGAR|nr:hypothetical protein BDP27DRAFT_1371470 [Rhodocollybia butyracea]